MCPLVSLPIDALELVADRATASHHATHAAHATHATHAAHAAHATHAAAVVVVVAVVLLPSSRGCRRRATRWSAAGRRRWRRSAGRCASPWPDRRCRPCAGRRTRPCRRRSRSSSPCCLRMLLTTTVPSRPAFSAMARQGISSTCWTHLDAGLLVVAVELEACRAPCGPAAGRRRRRGRCPRRWRRGWRAGRLRAGPCVPSSRSRWRRRP